METKCYATKQPRDHGRNKKRNKNYLETNDSKIRKTQILWDAAKAVQKRKFIAIQSYLKKQ